MGLDMYLTKKNFIGANYAHRNVNAKIDIEINGHKVKIDPTKISEITESAGYWRKANAIHKWFVNNVQDGKDNCEEYFVPYQKLVELKTLCEQVLKTKDTTLLPPMEGFFFGSIDVDDYYFEELPKTIEIINSLDPDADYYYHASW